MNETNLIDQLFELHAVEHTYKKGAYLYHKDEPAQGIFRVLKGRVKLCKGSKGYNRMITFYWIYPSVFFGILDFLFNNSIRRCNAIAIDKEVIVQCISFSKFEEWMLSNPEGSFQIIQTMINNTNTNWVKYSALQKGKINQRVLNALKKMAQEHGIQTDQGLKLEGISHYELADYIGMSRQGVTSSLLELKQENIIDYNRKFILIKQKP